LWPVYHTRNGRGVAEAELSRSVLNAVAPLAADADGPPATIVLVDDPNVRPSLADAFGTLIEEAVSLIIGSRVHVSIEPPPPGSNPGQTTRREGPARVLRLHNGRLEP
jgi:hypothetical protein